MNNNEYLINQDMTIEQLTYTRSALIDERRLTLDPDVYDELTDMIDDLSASIEDLID